MESPQHANNISKEPTREVLPSRTQLTDNQTPTRANNSTTNSGNAPNSVNASPATVGNHSNNSSFTSAGTPNGDHLLNNNGASPLETSSSLAIGTRSNAVETTRDIGINSGRPTDVQVHRTRRSARNLEDASRRRSSRNPRQSTSNAQAVNLVRSGAALARPSLDLPTGYGKYCFSYLWQIIDLYIC